MGRKRKFKKALGRVCGIGGPQITLDKQVRMVAGGKGLEKILESSIRLWQESEMVGPLFQDAE